jgi:dTMP kinase
MAVNRGRLVALEGLDGCGKTTQAARIADGAARARPRRRADARAQRRPDRPADPRARARGDPLPAEQELALFTDDRREHVALVIAARARAGRWVITDRYFLSTVAYQGARGLDWRRILARSEAEFPLPDAALAVRAARPRRLARARARGGAPDLWFEHGDYLPRSRRSSPRSTAPTSRASTRRAAPRP